MGGPAFPTMYGAERANNENTLFNVTNGMTLWDYYAAAALPAVISGLLSGHAFTANSGEPLTEKHIAEQTAEFVDAMLAERARRMEAES